MAQQGHASGCGRPRACARGSGPADHTCQLRGGRSGPSAANASTVKPTAANTVAAGSGAARAGTMAGRAPNVQQEAQALHFCWAVLPARDLAAAGSSPPFAANAAADASTGTSACSAWLLARLSLWPWWLCPPWSACAACCACAGAATCAAGWWAPPPWWPGPQKAMVAAARPCAGIAKTSIQTQSILTNAPMAGLYRSTHWPPAPRWRRPWRAYWLAAHWQQMRRRATAASIGGPPMRPLAGPQAGGPPRQDRASASGGR